VGGGGRQRPGLRRALGLRCAGLRLVAARALRASSMRALRERGGDGRGVPGGAQRLARRRGRWAGDPLCRAHWRPAAIAAAPNRAGRGARLGAVPRPAPI